MEHRGARCTHKRALAGDLHRPAAAPLRAGRADALGAGQVVSRASRLPRWALNLFWRTDGRPVWRDPDPARDRAMRPPRIPAKPIRRRRREAAGRPSRNPGALRGGAVRRARRASRSYWIAAYEDVVRQADLEQRLPVNIDPFSDRSRADPAHRAAARAAGWPKARIRTSVPIAGLVLPLKPAVADAKAASRSPAARWRSSRWPLRRERLFLVEGDSAARHAPAAVLAALGAAGRRRRRSRRPIRSSCGPSLDAARCVRPRSSPRAARRRPRTRTRRHPIEPREVIHTALCVRRRATASCTSSCRRWNRLEDSLRLIAAIEHAAGATGIAVRPEGYPPPRDPRLRLMSVTPDPGRDRGEHPSVVDLERAARQHARCCTRRRASAASRPRSSCSTAATPAPAGATT